MENLEIVPDALSRPGHARPPGACLTTPPRPLRRSSLCPILSGGDTWLRKAALTAFSALAGSEPLGTYALSVVAGLHQELRGCLDEAIRAADEGHTVR